MFIVTITALLCAATIDDSIAGFLHIIVVVLIFCTGFILPLITLFIFYHTINFIDFNINFINLCTIITFYWVPLDYLREINISIYTIYVYFSLKWCEIVWDKLCSQSYNISWTIILYWGTIWTYWIFIVTITVSLICATTIADPVAGFLHIIVVALVIFTVFTLLLITLFISIIQSPYKLVNDYNVLLNNIKYCKYSIIFCLNWINYNRVFER